MVNLERAIYTVTYYWHGITRRGIHGVLWLFDTLHNLELLSWSNVGGLPYNQAVTDKIDGMIANGDLCITDRWSNRFSKIGLEPIQSKNRIRIYKSSERFSDNFRLSVWYYVDHPEEFKQLYSVYENKPLNKNKFYDYILNKIQQDAREKPRIKRIKNLKE
jgi:hypothetical protein